MTSQWAILIHIVMLNPSCTVTDEENTLEVTTERLKNLPIGTGTLIINQWPFAVCKKWNTKETKKNKINDASILCTALCQTEPL